MAALLSPAEALELTTELTTEQVYKVYEMAFGAGPILTAPTAADPLSYHGTIEVPKWGTPLHSFWVYPWGKSLVNQSWDTYDVTKFCSNYKFGD
jgi:hypothetical protein